jgi:hypothetical protein
MLLVAGVAVAVAANLFARGVGVGIPAYRAEWIWRPLSKAIPVNLLPASLAGAGLALLVWGLGRGETQVATRMSLPHGERRVARGMSLLRALAPLALVLVVFALQIAMINAVGEPWVAPGAIIASPVSTTYFAISREVHSVRDYLANYHQIMPTLPYHAATHPPGVTLLFLAVRRACAALTPASAASSPVIARVQFYADRMGVGFPPEDAAAAIASALLLAMAGSASILPIYLLAGQLAGPRGALCAAALTGSLPALVLLPASADQLVLLAAAVTIWLAYAAWRHSNPALALLPGIAFALGMFVSLGFAAVGAWLALWAALGVLGAAGRGEAARRLLGRAGVALGGFAAVYLTLFLATGYRAWTVAYLGLFAHRRATTVEFPRTYWKWVLMNPVEMAVFAGLALVVAALWAKVSCWASPGLLGRSSSSCPTGLGLLGRRSSSCPTGLGLLGRSSSSCPTGLGLRAFLVSWLIVVAALDLSGTVRGEVGRIWLFLMWPLALAAGEWLSRAERYAAALTLVVMMQLAQALAMRGYLTMYDIF